MKKLMILVVLISLVGVFTMGCGTNDEQQAAVNDIGSSQREEQADMKTGSELLEEQNEVNNEIENAEQENEEPGNTESAQRSGDAEEVLFSYFEALADEDIEEARKYLLFDDLGFPYLSLEALVDKYKDIKPQDIVNTEKISEDMQLIHVNMKSPEEEYEDSYLLTMAGGSWYVASGGIVSRQKSVYTEEQVKDGEVGIYLQNIYHAFNGIDTYVINIVNNTSEILRIGFVNNGAIIYENNAGKEYVDFETTLELSPYNSGEIYFTANSNEGLVKTITLKEVMLGLQAQTSDVEVLMGEMMDY